MVLLGLLLTAPVLVACGRQGPLRLPDEAPPRERTAAPEAEDNQP